MLVRYIILRAQLLQFVNNIVKYMKFPEMFVKMYFY